MRKPIAIILISLAGIAACFARPGVWTALPSPTTENLRRICVSGSEAWLLDNTIIYHSCDYPSVQFTPQFSGTNFNDFTFLHQGGRRYGWAVGYLSLGARTTDSAGHAWTQMLLGGTSTYTCVVFPTTLLGFASGSDTRLHKTVNGGLNWFDAGVQLSFSNVNTLFFTDSSTGYVGTSDPRLAQTTDGGATWFDVGEITDCITDIFFLDSAHGWVVGAADIVRFHAGEWSRLNNPSGRGLYSVFFVNQDEGWAVGNDGTILHSTDGGASWTAESSGTSEDLRDVFFTSPTNGYAVGRQGTILRYTRTGDVEERPMQDASRMTPNATIVRGVLRLSVDSRQKTACRAELLDISGRSVLDLHPGANDVSRLSPGVYFMRQDQAQAQAQAVGKLVIAR